MNEQVRHRAVQALEGEPGKVAVRHLMLEPLAPTYRWRSVRWQDSRSRRTRLWRVRPLSAGPNEAAPATPSCSAGCFGAQTHFGSHPNLCG